MSLAILLVTLVFLTIIGFYLGRGRALTGTDPRTLHSRPHYHGYYVAMWCALPALPIVLAWRFFERSIVEMLVFSSLPAAMQAESAARMTLLINNIRNLATDNLATGEQTEALVAAAAHYRELATLSHLAEAVVVIGLAIGCALMARNRISPAFRARTFVERAIRVLLIICSIIAILTTVGIVLSLVFESHRFFTMVSPADFLFGLEWSPQVALRKDQVGATGAFGAVPLFAGTMLISLIAMMVAAPIGVLSAIYMAEYAPKNVRATIKPILEILAGIPTVVYGFFAALTVAPVIRGWGQGLGLDVASECALAAGLVMGIMIIPFVSSLSDDVINAVPQTLRDGSYALGATRSETVRRVIVPAAFPGIVGSVLLAVSRAIGETMIVVMAAGLAANLTINPLEAVTTVTVQIVTLLVGDQEFDSAKTLAAFALGLALFCVTLVLNIIALKTVRKYREKYD